MPNSDSTSIKLPSFSNSFSSLTDPRRVKRGNFKYPLEEIMFLVISAVISDSNNWSQIQIFGECKLEWLQQHYPYKHGIPSEDVLASLFARLNGDEFCQCFIDWIQTKTHLQKGEVIAIDGKTARGSDHKKNGTPAIHVISAYASQNKVTLGQQVVSDKSNEITAIPRLL